MKDIDIENLDTAITLGDAVCNKLGICCEKRGQVIFHIYQRLEELKPKPHQENEGKQDTGEVSTI